MNFLVVLTLILLAACNQTVKDYSFISLKGEAVERYVPPAVVETPECNEPAPEAPEVIDPETLENNIYFSVNSYEVDPDCSICVRYAQFFKSINAFEHISGGKLMIDGHCDERGSRDYNMGLGMRRAAAVKDALVAQGIAEDLISIRSFGKEKPFVWGSTEEAWAKNRVVVIRYLG